MSFGFGAAPAGAPPPTFGAPAQPSLFGNTQPQQQSAPSLFGAAPASQSLFGGQQSQPVFGAPASQSVFGGGASQSLFGAQSSQSLFGAQSSQSLFGAQSSQSLFGAQASQPLFGAQSSQSLFGAQSSQSLFGAPASQSLFGAPSSQSLFGATPAQGMFGATQPTSLFGVGQTQQQMQYPQQPQQPQQPQLPRALMELIDRLNPMRNESSMHAALYNVVSPSDVSRYGRPAAMNESLWDAAVANNPDPSRMVPVQANNFDDLLRRSEMQTQRIQEHGAVLSQIEEGLSQMESAVEGDVTTRLATYRRRHRELARKLLRLASVVDMETARGDRATLTVGEAERRKKVVAIARALAEPAEFKDKLADLVELGESHVLERRARKDVEIRDVRAAGAIRNLLGEQLKGIEHLAKVCEKAKRDLDIVTEGVGER